FENINFNVLILVTDGNINYSINEKVIIAKKGDLLFIPKKTKRRGENYRASPHRKYTILFSQRYDKKIGIPFIDHKLFLRFQSRNFEYNKYRFNSVYMNLMSSRQYSTFICLGILQELIGTIARDLNNTKIPPIKLVYVQTIQDFLVKNYRKNIAIDQLAKLIKKSPNYTISIFKEVTKQTPIAYMHQLRIEEACQFLIYSDMDIVNISDYLGYYDVSYFSRTFKKITSLSPSEFRLQRRSN